MKDVKRDWINTAGVIDDVANPCHEALIVSYALEESWDPNNVHFLITAKEAGGDEDFVEAAEKRDIVPELPLQTLNRSKL